jgi:hypothetical protein
MIQIRISEGEAILGLSIGELNLINNAINEVCNGIDIPEFSTRIGASVEEVATLLREISDTLARMEKMKNEKG